MEEILIEFEIGGKKYYASNMGYIKNCNGKILKGNCSKRSTDGYVCHPMPDGKVYRRSRIIAGLFIQNTENKPFVDHINTNRTDDRVENLRWVTAKENSNNPITLEKYHNRESNRKGVKLTEETKSLISHSRKGKCCGASHPKAKKVTQLAENGDVIFVFDCITSAAKSLSEDRNLRAHISKCCRGKEKTAAGFRWKYV